MGVWNAYDCDAYDSGYCYQLRRPLTDEEDDMCWCGRCCIKELNKELNKDKTIQNKKEE